MDTVILTSENLSEFKESLSLSYSDKSVDLLSVKIGSLKYGDLDILLKECYRIIRKKGRLIVQFRDIKEMADKVNYSNVMGDIANLLYVDGKDDQVCGMNNESLNKLLSLNKFRIFKEKVSPDGMVKQNIYKKMDGYNLNNITFHYLARYLQISIKALNTLMDNLELLEMKEREIYLTEEEYKENAVTSLIKQLIDPLIILKYEMPGDRILLYKKNIDCLLWDDCKYEEAILLRQTDRPLKY